MNIIDYLRQRFSKKETDNKKIEVEETEEEKITKKILSNKYDCIYLFRGRYDKTHTLNNGKTVTYSHSECFLANSKYPTEITKVKRITGSDLDDKTIEVIDGESWSTSSFRGYHPIVEDNNIKYILDSMSLSKSSHLEDQYISGYHATTLMNQYNAVNLNYQLEQIAKQDEIDKMLK